jgi:tetratricopeptide (TPR) repeat protein
MDPDNPVVRLCVKGVEAETANRFEDARALFEQAWRSSTNDVEACIAAHYLARHQQSAVQTLWWNQIALARADATRDERVRGFYPSLHLNLAQAHENLGQLAAARHHYERAGRSLDEIEDLDHRFAYEDSVARGLERTANTGS